MDNRYLDDGNPHSLSTALTFESVESQREIPSSCFQGEAPTKSRAIPEDAHTVVCGDDHRLAAQYPAKTFVKYLEKEGKNERRKK